MGDWTGKCKVKTWWRNAARQSKKSVCLPLEKGGQKQARKEGGGGVSFSVSLKESGGREAGR